MTTATPTPATLRASEALIAGAATLPGRALIWIAAALLLPREKALLLCPLLLVFFLLPARRGVILSAGALWVLYDVAFRHTERHVGATVAVMLFGAGLCYLCFVAARSYRRLPAFLQRHAQLVLHAGLWGALALAWGLAGAPADPAERTGASKIVSGMLFLVPFLIWRCGYVLLSGKRGSARESGFFDHFFYLLPAFGGSSTPYGKGYDYLRQNRAEAAAEIAKSQLSGVKLLALAWLWTQLRAVLRIVVYGDTPAAGFLADLYGGYSLGLPRLSRLVGAPDTVSAPISVLWGSLVFDLVFTTLNVAIVGHVIVGSLRLFGYPVFRNTYRPLVAQSVVEFWNRYYYYFKELLVEFFFFPTYVAYFKTMPRLRIFAATMSAAFLGNVYYHVLRDLDDLIRAGPGDAAGLVAPRVFYAFLLGAGIFVSMLRERQRRGSAIAPAKVSGWALRVRRIAGVWLFYSLIHIWNVGPTRLTFGQRTHFFLSLLSLG